MHKKIAGQAFPIIRKATPPEEASRVKRTLRSADEKLVPVDGLLARVRRNGIDPRAARRVAVRRAFDEEHIAEGSRCIKFASLLVDDGTHALAANLHDAISFLHSVHHGEAIFDVVRHRLLAIHILARGTGVDYNAAMLVVRDGDDYGVYVFAVQNFFVMASCGDLFLYGLLRGLVPAVIKIADGDAFNAGYGERGLQKLAATSTGADRCKSYSIARRNWTFRTPQRRRLQESELDRGSGCDRA